MIGLIAIQSYASLRFGPGKRTGGLRLYQWASEPNPRPHVVIALSA